jgi:hypothetical protein
MVYNLKTATIIFKKSMNKEYIEQRANGWIEKIEQLYSFIAETLKDEPDVRYKTDQNMIMREEMMERHGVSPKQVPIFDLFVKNQLKVTFKPIGLWVIGAKGRVDILTPKGAYILADIGDDDIHPHWAVFASGRAKRKQEVFDAEFVKKLVH